MSSLFLCHATSRRFAAGYLTALVFAAWPRPAKASNIVPTVPLVDANGGTVGFATNEPGLYFLIPSGWTVNDSPRTPVRLTEAPTGPGGGARYDLRLVLSPDYRHAAPAVASVRAQDPTALFFPLPSSIQRVTLFLPEALGGIEAQLVPDEDGLATPVALYYRLRFDEGQLAVLRQLARGGLVLQGTVEYAYSAQGGSIQETAAPLTVWLNESALVISTAPPIDPLAWPAELLTTGTMSVHGALDRSYTVGSIVVQITNSLVEGSFVPGTWAVIHDGSSILQVTPTAPSNFAGRLSFDLPLGGHIRIDYQASVVASLDLSLVRLAVPQFQITHTTINGASNLFYTLLLGNLAASPSVRADVAEAMTDQLQRAILLETLIGLGDVLP